MLNWDVVWRRVSQLPDWRGYSQADFRYVGIGRQFSINASVLNTTATVDFPVGSIILDIGGGVSVAAVATAEIRSLNSIRLGLDYSGQLGSIISGGKMNGAALFGPYGDRQFPGKELLIPKATPSPSASTTSPPPTSRSTSSSTR